MTKTDFKYIITVLNSVFCWEKQGGRKLEEKAKFVFQVRGGNGNLEIKNIKEFVTGMRSL